MNNKIIIGVGIGLMSLVILIVVGIIWYTTGQSSPATTSTATPTVKPTPATPTATKNSQNDSAQTQKSQVVNSNNGTVSCNTYCRGTGGKPWNNELPVDWNGAMCTATNLPGIDCNTAPGQRTGFQCTCAPTGTGWN